MVRLVFETLSRHYDVTVMHHRFVLPSVLNISPLCVLNCPYVCRLFVSGLLYPGGSSIISLHNIIAHYVLTYCA